jgi:hypothetical protein
MRTGSEPVRIAEDCLMVTGDGREPDALTARFNCREGLTVESRTDGVSGIPPTGKSVDNGEHKPHPEPERRQSTRPEHSFARQLKAECSVRARSPQSLCRRLCNRMQMSRSNPYRSPRSHQAESSAVLASNDGASRPFRRLVGLVAVERRTVPLPDLDSDELDRRCDSYFPDVVTPGAWRTYMERQRCGLIVRKQSERVRRPQNEPDPALL